ncbi:MAG: aminoglycoside phosphotransferase [Cyclobacteriaceae bacterium]|nr:MAG: aminoglycoside phosphotransferase [Cyclobacteriaceae bacterium]
MEHEAALAERQFEFPGPVVNISPFGSGHIHDTYLISCSDTDSSRFVLQKFNHNVFKNPQQVMINIQKVLSHLDQPSRLEPMQIIRTRQGELLYQSDDGVYWRVFSYLDHSESFDQLLNRQQAREAAGAFGCFLEMLSEMDSEELYTTIPDFHHLGTRFDQLKEATRSGSEKRMKTCPKQIEFALSKEPQVIKFCKFLNHPKVPKRVTHNDTKLNNVLFKQGTTQAFSVIDLDTVMPGLLLYDFGDMARTFCNSVPEEGEASQVLFRMDYFEALCEGFFSNFRLNLQTMELNSLKAGPWWMTFIMGIRFLTDYLLGDVYYKINYPEHNLNRAENQFALLADIENKQSIINENIDRQFGLTS